MSSIKQKSIITGTMITAGSAIGAGMFSLPIVSSGMWFLLAVISLVVIWLGSYLSSLMIMEVSLEYPLGASFDTFVGDILGKGWSLVMAISVCFLLYILLYAYFSAFGNMALHMFGWDDADSANYWLQGSLGLLLGLLLGGVVWVSTDFVGRFAMILVAGMAFSFVIAMSGAFTKISVEHIFKNAAEGESYLPYLWIGLPYFITSFGFSSVVPSLYKYYGKDISKIKGSLFFGSIIILLTYIIWLTVSFGILPRAEFTVINQAGGNVGHLVGALEQKIGSSTIQYSLNFFTNFAIISSFLGVGLSLFDYLADRFKFDSTRKGRFLTAALTFLPPGVASFFFPNGFIAAIGFAGLLLVIGFFIIPFLIVWKQRATGVTSHYRLSGGKGVLLFVLLIGLVTAVCHILGMLELLPKF